MSKKPIDAERMVVCAVVDLIRHKVFYGHILQQLGKVYIKGENSPLRTMGVGKKRDEMLVKLYVNIKWVESLFEKAKSEDQGWGWLLGVLEHETLHLVFNHLTLQMSDKIRGNVAMDLVVNCCIEKEKLPPNGMTVDMFGFPENKSSFWYYNNLKDNKKYQEMCKNGDFGPEGLFSDALDSHKIWEEAAQDPILGEFVRDLIRQAKDLCNKDYGSIPSQVIEQIDDMLEKKRAIVPWQKVLRLFCASAMESNLEYTMKRISKRFGTRPGTRKEDVLNLAVGVDTSGSISNEQLMLFFSEIRWIWRNGANVTVFECDCQLQRSYRFKGKFDGECHGRGGTDLEPVLREVEGKYDALIYFTDFYAPVIEHQYNIPILWVLTTELNPKDFPYKWGKHIKIEDGEAMPV
jgi:predicted metal-dependent peptidase